MKFNRHVRFEFKDTPRKRAAFITKLRRERESVPLLSEQVAEEQAAQASIDEIMQQRAQSFAKYEHDNRRHRAKKWREARAKLAAYDDASRAVIRRLWNDAPYPADPVYLLGMLRDIENGRISLNCAPPWRPTKEEIECGRAAIEQYTERRRAEQNERSR